MSQIFQTTFIFKQTSISKRDEKFLKDFSRDVYYKIIDTNDINTIENTLSEWIKNTIDKKNTRLLQCVQCVSSIVGLWLSEKFLGKGYIYRFTSKLQISIM